MKRSIGTAMLVIALTGFATLAEAQTVSAPLPHYTVTPLSTLGGTYGSGYGGVTNNGWVSGDSSLSASRTELADHTEHASVWRDGVITDLGTLGGANSAAAWPQKNTHGLIVGATLGSQIDPLKEYWGVAYTCPEAVPCDGWQNLESGFRWQNGVMTALPTLGGYNSEATGDNNLGQVVGIAETAAADPMCPTSPTNQPNQQLLGNQQLLVINAVVWGPRGEVQQQLHPLPGDDLSAAFGINDNGDVVGCSGTCGIPDTPALCRHAVLWRNGRAINLGGLGGAINNYPVVINNAGQIAGISDPPGDATTYAVVWQNGANKPPTDLGALPGDVLSVTQDMNAQGQVVGYSCDVNFNCRAFLWDHGVMIDLNSLVSSPLYLTVAEGINDRGEISGNAYDPSNPNETPAFLAVPAPAARIAGASARKIILPEKIRASLQRRLRLRHFGGAATAAE